ncbi:MAG: phospholipase D-like domain-containing protein [Vicinamibacterales bacterium]
MTGAARSSERKRWGAGARLAWTAVTAVLSAFVATPAAATDWTFFPAVDNVTAQLVAHINAETVRIDMSAWYLTERAVSIALVNRHRAGVPVRLIGDRVSIFESDPLTRAEFYWLASQEVPIRLRYFPTGQPEIVHWKATIFSALGRVTFGSANYTPFELAPVSAADYKDEVVTITDDPSLVNAFRTKFDRMWHDATPEAGSRAAAPPTS